jgi:osmotically inducible protein OsmC
MKRTAQALWNGNLQTGHGHMSSQSGVLKDQPYSFKTRFENEDGQAGTNPEELIAAAHAACFSMALSNMLAEGGFTPDSVETKATLTLSMEGGPKITTIHLHTEGKVPNLTADKFQEFAHDAKANCPISQVLNAEITLEAILN